MSIVHNEETKFWYNHYFGGKVILCPICLQIQDQSNLEDLDHSNDQTEWKFRCKCHQVFVLIIYDDIDDLSDVLW